MRIDHFIVEGDRHKGDYVMTIRFWAGAGVVAFGECLGLRLDCWSCHGQNLAASQQHTDQRQ